MATFRWRRPLTTIVSAGVITALFGIGAGCTLLVSFDDKPRDSGVPLPDRTTQPTSSNTNDTGPEPDEDSGLSPPDPSKCDLAFDRAAIKGCVAFQENGQICGDNQGLTNYPGNQADRGKDVVTCSKTRGVICVQHCATKCAHLPEGFPDQCDLCAGRFDGMYCGLEMQGWPNNNFNLLIKCTAGRMVEGATAGGGPRNCGAAGCQPGANGTARCL
jgi:hypothetical protein